MTKIHESCRVSDKRSEGRRKESNEKIIILNNLKEKLVNFWSENSSQTTEFRFFLKYRKILNIALSFQSQASC